MNAGQQQMNKPWRDSSVFSILIVLIALIMYREAQGEIGAYHSRYRKL